MRKTSNAPAAAMGTLLLCSFLLTTASDANEAPRASDTSRGSKMDFNIPGQSLADALAAWSRQSGLQVLRRDDGTDFETRAVTGKLSPAEALERMLSTTGLTYEFINDRTVRVAPARAQPLETQGARNSDTASTGVQEILEVLVTGTHIRGTENPTAPLIVMDREFIDASGATNTVRLIESLPQNFALVNQSAAGGTLSGNSLSQVQGASINLRGMGEGTTLTLVNGRRMPLGYEGSAVNIAALPMSALDRVEVLTDGASALYGSDAVGGVVNFVFRQDFDGAETAALYGHADDVDELRLSQTFGRSWQSGNFVASAEHYARDMLLASDRGFGVGRRSDVPSLLPEEDNYGLTLFGRQDLTANLNAFLDVIYTNRDSFNRSRQLTPTSSATVYIDNTQLSAASGIGWDIGRQWRADFSIGYGEDDLDVHIVDPLSAANADIRSPIEFTSTAFDVKADGPIFDLPGGPVRIAIGGHWREEELISTAIQRNATGAIVAAPNFDKSREVGSLFAEASIPIVDTANAMPLLRALSLSLAARYDDYSDFGSSVDPRLGIAWTPMEGLKFRGSWGTSYLAPKMKDYDLAFNSATAVNGYVLANGLNVLVINGNAPESLRAQDAKNYTLGVDWTPERLPGVTLAANYYDIDYRNKIETLNVEPAVILGNPTAYGELVVLDPTVQQVNEYIAYGTRGGRPFAAFNPNFTPNPNFDPATVQAIFDTRRRNVGVVETKGVDLSAAWSFAVGGGQMRLGFDGTYIIEILKQLTATSTSVDQLDTYGNPTRLRLRASINYRLGGWSFNGFVHRRNSYTDNRVVPFEEIDAYTTVDVNAGYRFASGSGVLADASITLGAINVFDRDPPAARIRSLGFYDLGFDAANASPLGRQVSLGLSKRW